MRFEMRRAGMTPQQYEHASATVLRRVSKQYLVAIAVAAAIARRN
jgi:hypothetical protein